MAGTILTSSPHNFSAVEDYHAFFMKNKQAGSGYLAEQTKDPQITLPVWTNKLCTTSLRRKDSMPTDSWHPCTESSNEQSPSLYALAHRVSQEGPNERPKPIHAQDHPSAALQIQTQACLSESRWKPTEGPKHNKHQSKPKPMQSKEGPHCHFIPLLSVECQLLPGTLVG